jgi:hypothetical protein
MPRDEWIAAWLVGMLAAFCVTLQLIMSELVWRPELRKRRTRGNM